MRRARILFRSTLVAVWLGGGLNLPAHAEPGPAPPFDSGPDVAHDKALQTFKEGIEAFDRRDFEAARVAFLQTFALKPTAPVVRRNLGLAEIYSGHYLEGARRLARVIHTTHEGSASDRQRMLESLKKAETHLERLTIEVNVEGADIAVGEIELGSSPLPFVWYVGPGAYDVRVSKAGFVAFSETRLARAGATQHLRISLEPIAPEAVVSPATPAPLRDVAPETGPNPWLLAAGGVLTAGGVAAGVTFSVLAAGNADEVEQLGDSLAGVSCRSSSLSQCRQLSDAASAHDRQRRWATVSFSAAGVFGVTTLLYGLLARSDGVRNEQASLRRWSLERQPGLLAIGIDGQSSQLLWNGTF
jgi:hypothetical protein